MNKSFGHITPHVPEKGGVESNNETIIDRYYFIFLTHIGSRSGSAEKPQLRSCALYSIERHSLLRLSRRKLKRQTLESHCVTTLLGYLEFYWNGNYDNLCRAQR